MRIAFLGHHQPTHGFLRPEGGYLSKEDAELLVNELAAERVSKKVIRAFAPGSSFRVMNRQICRNFIPDKLPPKEVANVKFCPPEVINSNTIRSRFLPRYREVYGDDQLRRSEGVA